MWECGLDASGAGWCPLTLSCKHSNEQSAFIKEILLNQLSDSFWRLALLYGASTKQWLRTFYWLERILFMSVWWECLWIAATNWPIIHPPDDIRIWGGMILDRGKRKNSEKELSQCHFVLYKSHMDWLRRASGPPGWEAGD